MSVDTQAKRDEQEAYDRVVWDQKREVPCTIQEGLILDFQGMGKQYNGFEMAFCGKHCPDLIQTGDSQVGQLYL